MGMERDPASAMIITVLIGAHRPIEDKSKLVAAINRLVVEALEVSADDIFIALIPVPNANFSFRRGALQLADGAPRWEGQRQLAASRNPGTGEERPVCVTKTLELTRRQKR